jgi:hypothetical protein
VSKRSYRRLAVVAGAALAVGSMAPAMAQRIDVDADANASVDAADLITVLPLDVVDVTGLVNVGTVQAVNSLVMNDVTAIVNALNVDVGDITADVLATTTANVGAISANVANVTATVSDVSATVSNVAVPVTVSGVNVLGAGIANNGLVIANLLNGFGGFGLFDANANVLANVLTIL